MKKIYVPYINPMGKLDPMLDVLHEILDGDEELEIVEMDISDERREVYMEPLKGVDGILFGATNVLGDLMNPMWDIINDLENEKNKETPEIVVGSFGCYDFFGEGVSFVMNRLKTIRVQSVGKGVCVQWDPKEKDIKKLQDYFKEYVAQVKARPEV